MINSASISRLPQFPGVDSQPSKASALGGYAVYQSVSDNTGTSMATRCPIAHRRQYGKVPTHGGSVVHWGKWHLSKVREQRRLARTLLLRTPAIRTNRATGPDLGKRFE